MRGGKKERTRKRKGNEKQKAIAFHSGGIHSRDLCRARAHDHPLKIVCHHGGVKGGSSLSFAKDRIEIESSRIWREWKAGSMARLGSLRGRRRHVRCPWPTIKSSLSRKWAARRLKQSIEGRESDDRCRQYSNSISVPAFFGPALVPVEHRLLLPPRAVSFYFIGVQ